MEGKKVYEDFKIQLTLSLDEFRAIYRRMEGSGMIGNEPPVRSLMFKLAKRLGIGLYEKEEN